MFKICIPIVKEIDTLSLVARLNGWGWLVARASLVLILCGAPLAKPPRAAEEAVVAASHPLAAEAGARILRAGGNALDAAAAVQFALNVVEPQSSGLGGGAFVLIYLAKTGQTIALDAREQAPHRATADQFAGHDFEENSTNGIAVGVPGTLAGFAQMQHRWGRKSLAQVLQPAIELARHGFAITPYLAHALQSPRAALQPETRALFRHPDGTPLVQGEWLRQPALARTFSLLARRGPDEFYRGSIAQAIVAAQQRTRLGPAGRGRMTRADLAAYRPRFLAPLAGHYRQYDILTMPPPSSGGVALLQALGMLERFPLAQQPSLTLGEPGATHLTIEALRLALADREHWLGDPAASVIPLSHLLDPAYLRARSQQIQLTQRIGQILPENGQPEGGQTTHFSIVDAQGNVVSCTTTVESLWGSGIMVPGYGFMLNNELTDFNLVPHAGVGDPGANDVRPGLRPRSSMTPVLVFAAGQWRMAYGSPGGVTIISTVLEMTQDLLDGGLAAGTAIARPRFAVLDAAGHTLMEPQWPELGQQALRALGHPLLNAPNPLGSIQIVGADEPSGLRWGAADARREGTVLRVKVGP